MLCVEDGSPGSRDGFYVHFLRFRRRSDSDMTPPASSSPLVLVQGKVETPKREDKRGCLDRHRRRVGNPRKEFFEDNRPISPFETSPG